MVEKISLALIDRDAIGFHAQCACIEFGGGSQCPVPETPRQWLEQLSCSAAIELGARDYL